MDNNELIKLAYDIGAYPYSVGNMVSALQKGIEIGKEEQKAIDDDYWTNRLNTYNQYDKLRTLAYNMYTAAQYLTTDASKLKKAYDDFYHYINFEENGK